MSSTIWASINATTTSGTMLAAILTDFKDALMSGMTGTTRPANLQAAGMWIDTTNESSPNYYWSFKVWTGTVDIEIFRLNVDVGYGGALISASPFEVHHYGADVTGPILQLIKQRRPTANNGQILDGDVVGELRMVGRTDTSTDPVVAKMIFSTSDDNTTLAYGGSFGFYSTPDASATLTQHLRFIAGVIETTVPHKLNSEILVTQNIATAASILALDATYVGVEMTGATATAIHGVSASGNTKEIMIHNRSTAVVTLKHESSSATAVNRLTLPNAFDIALRAQDSAVLIYNTTDTRWKLKSSTSRAAPSRSIDTVIFSGSQWTAPTATQRVRIIGYSNVCRINEAGFIDQYGNAFLWGINTTGNLGLGDVIPRSSPVAVLGGLTFRSMAVPPASGALRNVVGISTTGIAYAWGDNTRGQLGVGDVIPRSSPVAVLGGLKFQSISSGGGGSACMGLTTGGSLYAWGTNTWGQLGVGNTTDRSSPVAVLGGIVFTSFDFRSDINGGTNFRGMCVGLDNTGKAYAWGTNDSAQLGVGNSVDRSSPVAVLGGLSFSSVKISRYTSEFHCLGMTTSGQLYAWGNNAKGQLGVGDTVNRSSPVAVLGGLTFVDYGTAAQSASWGLTSNGTLYMWGWNNTPQGTLGVGDLVDRSSPVAVLGSIAFQKITSGDNAVFGLATDGTLYSWGLNTTSKELGIGSAAGTSSPVAVLGGLKFSDVLAAANNGISVYAARPDGTLYSWGYNLHGELGQGDTSTGRSSPVAVLGGMAVDNSVIVSETTINVTAGSVYTVVLGDRECSFGNTPLGTGLNKITIEYER